ncbi:uncharacterized protein LOC124137152 isoform X2 [Haliotis rufescens]|uniref:uncharacterized protein LOC124137152 isoform X2 n=1 Tax=Haliotis rufescens TaxID=6454 RepID=UPI00201F320D|nr:uncharacterized protein LOC124137152 isoform X2 [Haliotis rufescens]
MVTTCYGDRCGDITPVNLSALSMDTSYAMVAGYFMIIIQLCIRPARGNCPDQGFQLINICRRPQDEFSFTMGSIRLHPQDLQPHLSMCVCQLTVNRYTRDLLVARRHYPAMHQLFDIYILTPDVTVNASNVSFENIIKPIDEESPWNFVVRKRNASRNADDDSSTYCFSVRSSDKTTLSLNCETFPRRPSETLTQVSVTVLASCLMGVAVACFVAGACIAYCCSNRFRVRQLTGETAVCQFRDSGIDTSNQDNHHLAEEVDTSNEYATVDCRKFVHGIQEDGGLRMTTVKASADTDKSSLVTMENDLYE